jgi:hypothetical protein
MPWLQWRELHFYTVVYVALLYSTAYTYLWPRARKQTHRTVLCLVPLLLAATHVSALRMFRGPLSRTLGACFPYWSAPLTL